MDGIAITKDEFGYMAVVPELGNRIIYGDTISDLIDNVCIAIALKSKLNKKGG